MAPHKSYVIVFSFVLFCGLYSYTTPVIETISNPAVEVSVLKSPATELPPTEVRSETPIDGGQPPKETPCSKIQRGSAVNLTYLEKFTVFPWTETSDSQCRNFDISFDKTHSLSIMALVSYPGSGNTWIRQLIERSTGYFTGSIYNDKTICAEGGYGEIAPSKCKCTIVQKTHDFSIGIKNVHNNKSTKLKDFQYSGILILRNPLKAILAYRNLMVAGHTGLAPEGVFRDWQDIIQKSLMTWKELAVTWISKTKKGGVIFYENMVHEPETELRRLIELIGVPLNEERINCTLKHGSEKFHRPSKTYSKDLFSKNTLMLTKMAINAVQKALEKRGWPKIPLRYYEYLKE